MTIGYYNGLTRGARTLRKTEAVFDGVIKGSRWKVNGSMPMRDKRGKKGQGIEENKE
jgi:hypothetical protein